MHEGELARGRVLHDSPEGLGLKSSRHTIVKVSHETFILGKLLLLALCQAFLRVHYLSNPLHIRIEVLYSIFVGRVD